MDDFQYHILRELKFHFNIITVSKTTITDYILSFNQNIPSYNFEFVQTPFPLEVLKCKYDETMKYTVIERTSLLRHFSLRGLNCNLRSKVILSGALSIGNITLQNVF